MRLILKQFEAQIFEGMLMEGDTLEDIAVEALELLGYGLYEPVKCPDELE